MFLIFNLRMGLSLLHRWMTSNDEAVPSRRVIVYHTAKLIFECKPTQIWLSVTHATYLARPSSHLVATVGSR